MTTRIIVVLLGILSFAGLATAQEARRFPQDHISVGDWNTYLAEVKAMPNVTVRESEQQTTIAQEKTSTIYVFTTPANPAHPGIVVRRVVRTKDGYGLNRMGYYAGDVNAFGRWWHAFDALDEKIKVDLNSAATHSGQAGTADVQVRKNANGTFNLMLVSRTVSNLHDAQMALLQKAKEVCEGKRPTLGVYKLETLEKVAGATAGGGTPAGLKLDQEIICE